MRSKEDEATLREVDAFYDRVYWIMNKSGLELKDLARRMGISESSLNSMIGNREIPDVFTLRKMADALHVSYNELFTVNENMDSADLYWARPERRKSGSPAFYAREVAYYKVDADDEDELEDAVCVREIGDDQDEK